MLRRAHGVVLALVLGFGAPALATAQEPGDGSRFVIGPEIRVGSDLPDLPHVEPVIAVNPRDPGNLVVASIVVREPLSETEFHDSWTIHALTSTDAGATWTRHQLPALEPTFAGDPWLAWAEDGPLYLSALATVSDEARGDPTRALLYESRDGGRTWSGPVEAPTASSESLDHPVIDVAEGRLFVFASGDLPAITVARSPRSEKSLRALPEFRPDSLNNNLGAGGGFPDGRFVFSYFSLSVPQPSTLWAVRSDDGGLSYERSAITFEHIPVSFPRMAVDRSAGTWRDRVYAVWTRSQEHPDVMLAHSDDYGASWSVATRVQTDTSRTVRTLPAVAVNGDGTLMAAWIDGRHHEGDCWDVYAAASFDGGVSFLPEQRLTARTTCPRASGNRNGGAAARWRWGGDYIGLEAAPDGAFYVVWSDSRTGVYQLYARRLSVE